MRMWLALYCTTFPVAYALLRTSRRVRRVQNVLLGYEATRIVRELHVLVVTPLWLPLLVIWVILRLLERLE